jgi:hypothetical protein
MCIRSRGMMGLQGRSDPQVLPAPEGQCFDLRIGPGRLHVRNKAHLLTQHISDTVRVTTGTYGTV